MNDFKVGDTVKFKDDFVAWAHHEYDQLEDAKFLEDDDIEYDNVMHSELSPLFDKLVTVSRVYNDGDIIIKEVDDWALANSWMEHATIEVKFEAEEL